MRVLNRYGKRNRRYRKRGQNRMQQGKGALRTEQRNRYKCIGFILVSILITRVVFYVICSVKFGSWSFQSFLTHADLWDAEWYRRIATEGYPSSATATASWPFFPLYPLTAKAVAALTGGNLDLAGFLVSNVCYGIACLYSYRYIMLTRENEEEAYFYIALMTYGACGFYDSILYTEAMYLMFLTMCWCYLKEGRYLRMGICGALMSATRNTGVFFVFVVILHELQVWRRQRRENGERMNFIGFFRTSFSNERLVLGTMLVPSGLFAYMYYLYCRTGDGLAFVHIQKAFMLDTRPGMIQVWLRVFRLYAGQLWVYAYLIGLLLVLALILANRRGDETVWGLLNWVIPQQRGLGSLQRYFHTCVVVELTFSDYCMRLGRRARTAILIVMFLLECVLMSMWLDGNGLLV